MEVSEIYIAMCWDMYPVKPSRECIRAKARVSPSFAEKVMRELAETGHVLDPELVKLSWKKAVGAGSMLTTKMEIFLLALWLEAPERPNVNYIWQLNEYYRKTVSSGIISDWFKNRFPFRGLFWKANNLIPLDKFRKRNILQFLQYKKRWIFYLTTQRGFS
jgi:hypothetical protein